MRPPPPRRPPPPPPRLKYVDMPALRVSTSCEFCGNSLALSVLRDHPTWAALAESTGRTPDHYVTCAVCLIGLVGRALTPEQFLRAKAGGGSTDRYLLHDDFYHPDTGEAFQPAFGPGRPKISVLTGPRGDESEPVDPLDRALVTAFFRGRDGKRQGLDVRWFDIYLLADGFGVQTVETLQETDGGYDWSHVRDSTAWAYRNMARRLRRGVGGHLCDCGRRRPDPHGPECLLYEVPA